MTKIFNYKDNCWWCGNKADSSEHKYKKTDLVLEFGRGSYAGSNAIVRNIEGKQRKIQGPKSKEVKFDNNLCKICNNTKSQPFDRSYDQFILYIKSNEESILKNKYFIFSKIYGESWESDRLNLLRYYVKHICCRLASSNVTISPDIINFLNGSKSLKHLNFYLEIRQDIVEMIKKLKEQNMDSGCLWLGDLCAQKNKQNGKIYTIESFLGYRWMRFNYLYDIKINCSSDNFNGDRVMLPSSYNIAPEQK